MTKHIYLNEIIGERLRILLPILIAIGYGLGAILTNVMSIWLNEYRYYFYLSVSSSVVLMILSIWLIESPFLRFHKRDYVKMFRALERICKFNKSSQESVEIMTKIRSLIKLDLFEEIQQSRMKGKMISESKLFGRQTSKI